MIPEILPHWQKLERAKHRLIYSLLRLGLPLANRTNDQAPRRHYAQGAPPDWQQHFISAYASSHPWEDFAETWAHYLHIVDTLEMGAAFGLRIGPWIADGALAAGLDFDPYAPGTSGV